MPFEDEEMCKYAESRQEANHFYRAGKYLTAAMRWSLPSVEGPGCDPFYADAEKALQAWDKAIDEGNFS